MIPTCFVGVDPGRYGHGVVALMEDAPVQLSEKIANSEEAIAELIAGLELGEGPEANHRARRLAGLAVPIHSPQRRRDRARRGIRSGRDRSTTSS